MIDGSTIAAISTPVGSGGIGILRLSGPRALAIAAAIFQRPRQQRLSPADFKSFRLYYGFIRDPEGDCPIDEVLLAVMRAPRSYTREDMVEIQAHAGPAVLRAVLELLLRQGARLAEPGEFTRRAFVNGRIDLTEAEAVMDLIQARTEQARALAATQLQGGLKSQVQALLSTLNRLRARLEAAIDFPEDVGDILDPPELVPILRTELLSPLNTLLQNHESGRPFREGVSVAIAGRPNVGKSSLMNRLLSRERAIVTELPGTTRDLLEERLDIAGIPVVLTDTAGLHQSQDLVERIGIERAYERIQAADLVLFMIDGSLDVGGGVSGGVSGGGVSGGGVPPPYRVEDRAVYEPIREKPVILVINKSDKMDRPPAIPADWQGLEQVTISAKYGQGVEALKRAIAARFLSGALAGQDPVVPNLRHKQDLETAKAAIESACAALDQGLAPEFVSMDIQEAVSALESILGQGVSEDLLDRIFGEFCIGK